MQYGTHCFAGHTVGKYGKKPDTDCHMKCNHDKSRICGGPWRNTVVELTVGGKGTFERLFSRGKYGNFGDKNHFNKLYWA